MKTKENLQNAKKQFDTVRTFRKIKNKISTDLYDKNNEQIKEYLKTQSRLLQSDSV